MSRKPSIEEQMMESLKMRKLQYEEYFNSRTEMEARTDAKGNVRGPEMDNSATTAYTGLIKAIVELSKKTPREGKSPAEMKRVAEEILRTEYGIER